MTAAALQPPPEPATFREAVAAEARAHLARRRISNRRLAKMIGATPAWVDRRLNGTTVMDMDDVERIAGVLGITPLQLMAGAVVQPTTERNMWQSSAPSSARRPALALVPALPADDRSVALHYPGARTPTSIGVAKSADGVNHAYAS